VAAGGCSAGRSPASERPGFPGGGGKPKFRAPAKLRRLSSAPQSPKRYFPLRPASYYLPGPQKPRLSAGGGNRGFELGAETPNRYSYAQARELLFPPLMEKRFGRLTRTGRYGYSLGAMKTRARAVQRWVTDRLCAECGSRLVASTGPMCPMAPQHAGSVAAPSGTLARIMAEWGRGLEAEDALVAAHKGALAYWLLRRHAWGDHRLCPRLHSLLGPSAGDIGCLGSIPPMYRPPRPVVDLW